MKHRLVLLLPVLLAPSALTAKAQPSEYENTEVPAWLTIYVPAQRFKLEKRQVRGKLYRFMPTALSTQASVYAEQALPLLFKKARSSFPRGTKLTQFPSTAAHGSGPGEGIMHVSLSRQFLRPGFWNSRHKTFGAIYSIVNTAAEGYGSDEPLRVQILIEGKRVRNLANMDLRKPLRPRRDIIATR